jgi:hypothetical protein
MIKVKKIYLSGKYSAKFALVDDEDYEKLSKFSWHYNRGYARRNIKGSYTYMHHLIMDTKLVVDHINHDGLDNCKVNLRIATRSQNGANLRTTRKYKGVYRKQDCNRYEARIRFNNKIVYLGLFEDENKAAKAYNEKALELFGEFAYLNEIEGE